MELINICKNAKAAASALAMLSSTQKDAALHAMADALLEGTPAILQANSVDVANARANGMGEHKIDRLALSEKRIAAMAEGIREIEAQPDPIGAVISGTKRPNGLQISKVSVPMGVIGVIYESRPNVTSDIAALCIKAGNSVILRGGSEAINSNKAIVEVMSRAADKAGLPPSSFALITDTDRAVTNQMMRMREYIDLIIPRGGAGLIKNVIENSFIPVIETGTGNCHVYVDKSAEPEMAIQITVNAKASRPSVCNAAETLLIHTDIAESLLHDICKALRQAGVELRGDNISRKLVPDIITATDEDYMTEYSDLIMAVKVVDSIEQAVNHINTYSTKHSDAIVTCDYNAAQYFTAAVDSACVYVNASTRYSDGGEFGLGAEVGISTQKLHARGPMGVTALTTYKYVIFGNGQIRV